MFAAIPALWATATGWLSRNPVVIWIGMVILVLIGWEKIKSDIRAAAKKSERQANALRSAQRETEIIKTITENSNAMVRESERVRAADSAVVLPDGTVQLDPVHYRD
jgi:hypothetical protein